MTVSQEEQARRLAEIAEAEARYHQGVADAARKIVQTPGLRFITLSGPTCSAKTTTSTILPRLLKEAGKRCCVLSLDDFFFDTSHVNRAENVKSGKGIDFDSPEAFDHDCLRTCIHALIRGEKVRLPRFDFLTGRRLEGEILDPTLFDYIIAEGIQAVFPSVSCLFPAEQTFRIYISVADRILCDGVTVPRRTMRLVRRIIRDFNFRNAEPDFTLCLWKSVTDCERQYILPNEQNCDVILSSALSYEPHIEVGYLLAILDRIGKDSPYYNDARALYDLFLPITPWPSSLVDASSLLREFIGDAR